MLTQFVTHTKDDSREKREVRERIAIIQRYLDSISPKLSRYKELTNEKILLQSKLKKMK